MLWGRNHGHQVISSDPSTIHLSSIMRRLTKWLRISCHVTGEKVELETLSICIPQLMQLVVEVSKPQDGQVFMSWCYMRSETTCRCVIKSATSFSWETVPYSGHLAFEYRSPCAYGYDKKRRAWKMATSLSRDGGYHQRESTLISPRVLKFPLTNNSSSFGSKTMG